MICICEQICMRQATQLFNRRTRRCLCAEVAVLSLVLWRFMLVAESWTPLHAWLHGGSIPDNDDCAIVVIAHGKIDSVDWAVPFPVPTIWVELTPQIIVSEFSPAIAFLPLGRAPPASV